MKKKIAALFLACCLFCFALSAAGETAESAGPRCYALLIGNAEYLSEDMVALPEAVSETAALKKALEDLGTPWEVTVLQNLTGREFVPAMEEAFRNAGPEDVCLFYYSGHGMFDAENYPGALLGTDYGTNPENYVDTLLPQKTLADTLERLCPGRIIVILDCCGSGSAVYNGEALSWQAALSEASLEEMNASDMTRVGDLRRDRFSVLTSCEHGEWGYPFPDAYPIRAFIFTYCLLHGMGCSETGVYSGSMPADRDDDGALTLGEAMEYSLQFYGELRPDLPGDFPFQYFQSYGEEETVLFRR